MARFDLRLCRAAGLASALVIGGTGVALAQDAAAPQGAAPTAPSTGCSLLGCLFQKPQPVAAPQGAGDPSQTMPAAAADQAGTPADDKPARKVAKPVRPITIAADSDEVARLKGLSSIMPKETIKIVKTDGTAPAATTDFAVSTSLDGHVGTEKAKLFTEQMHIVAGDKIYSVSDLSGKVVSFGIGASGGGSAARKAFAALGVDVKETPLDVANALDGLATGDVDAVVILAPQPVAQLAGIKSQGLHLVAWPEDGAMPNGATVASIEASHYPALVKPGETVRAVGVDAVLSLSANGAKQPAARTFLTALSKHSSALAKRGFDLLKADLDSRSDRKVASAERR
jgi:hypothetical protein